MSQLSVDFAEYSDLVKALASLSRLFTTSNVAYVDSKFVENLYARTSNAENFALSDMSFDAILPSGAGVGVKTFRAQSIHGTKREKVAEFPKAARELELQFFVGRDLAITVSELRNKRVLSDAAEYNVALSSSIYHCLVRVDGGFYVHEEPYVLIDTDNLAPIDGRGKRSRNWKLARGNVHFTDGICNYSYNISKNVLYKTFDLSSHVNSPLIPIVVHEDPFKVLLDLSIATPGNRIDTAKGTENQEAVVLPLYAMKKGAKYVFPKSGINQWHAGGRTRSFGEAYIRIPQSVHRAAPGFFPSRDVRFQLSLPNGERVKAKVCQDNDKALMADPNVDLAKWLFATLDGSLDVANRRLEENRPYTYDDLLAIGKDCVEVIKLKTGQYQIKLGEIGGFESFLEQEDTGSATD